MKELGFQMETKDMLPWIIVQVNKLCKLMEIALKGTPSNLQIHQQEDGHDMKNKENSHISGKRISKETGKDKLQVGERIDIVEETSEECEEFQEKKSSKDKTVLNSVQIINNFLDTLFIILKK